MHADVLFLGHMTGLHISGITSHSAYQFNTTDLDLSANSLAPIQLQF
jgi:hypothetical protein